MATSLSAGNADLSAFLRKDADRGETLELAVEGVRCAGCMATIEKAMARQAGVTSARLNLTDKRLTVGFAPGKADPAAVIGRLGELGFKAYPFSPLAGEDEATREQRRMLRALGVAAFAAMNIMLLSVSVWSGHATGLDPVTRDLFHWVSALIALPTAAYSGRVFFDSAFAALKAGRVNMDVPITLGITLALGMSVVQTLNGSEHAYFDGAVMLIFFLLIGRTLEQAMRRRTRSIAGNLAALRADTVSRRMPDESWQVVPTDAVGVGDVILIRPGERVGLDGEVLTGSSDIDSSLVTGETAHKAVRAGDLAYAGTLNMSGALTLRVLKPHNQTLLADVERLIAKATGERGAYVKLADRAAQLYAPFVHATALATFLGWMFMGLGWSEALVIAITVLIITCPCALGLAIPSVQIAAAGAMFRQGVLINSGDALERLAEADIAVFDKTGTLTEPSLEIANHASLDAAALARAARLALASSHPLARPIAAAVPGTQPFDGVQDHPGEGVSTLEDGRTLKLGSPRFCDAGREAELLAERFPDASIVAFRDGGSLALFAIRQPLRADAAEAVASLQKQGLGLEILSGDHSPAVRA
ncbi:MAG: heavy metal translocating P-type ATPase, partial [Beijerinckiaceae bacterium]